MKISTRHYDEKHEGFLSSPVLLEKKCDETYVRPSIENTHQAITAVQLSVVCLFLWLGVVLFTVDEKQEVSQ